MSMEELARLQEEQFAQARERHRDPSEAPCVCFIFVALGDVKTFSTEPIVYYITPFS